jgi:hypothetical protein
MISHTMVCSAATWSSPPPPLALAAPQLALAQARPIRLVVPYAPGGPIDVTARLLAERVKDSLGTVIIDNKPGGGGNIGADIVAKAPPDGLTIGIAAVATHAINPWLFSKMPYDAAKDFAPITQMLRVPNVLVMNADTAGAAEDQHPGRPDRLCQGQPGQAQLRQRRQRQRGPPGRRDVQARRRHLCPAHPLQRRQPGAAGAAVGPGGLQLRQPGHRRAQHPRPASSRPWP